jgi:hypothetical protein
MVCSRIAERSLPILMGTSPIYDTRCFSDRDEARAWQRRNDGNQGAEDRVRRKGEVVITGGRDPATRRVTGIATEAQTLALIRSSQVITDRRINSNYIRKQQVFAESLEWQPEDICGASFGTHGECGRCDSD